MNVGTFKQTDYHIMYIIGNVTFVTIWTRKHNRTVKNIGKCNVKIQCNRLI